MGETTWSMKDHTNQPTSFTVPHIDLIETNITAQSALLVALQAELIKVSMGNIVRKVVTAASSPQGVNGPASDPNSQREAKATVIFQNLTTFAEPRKMTLPCVDQDKQVAGKAGTFYDREYPLEAHQDWQDFVAALEPILAAEAGGDTVEVLRAYQTFVS